LSKNTYAYHCHPHKFGLFYNTHQQINPTLQLMETIKDKVEAFNRLITHDETVKAMELFYTDDVELQENEDVPRAGKQACIEREKAALSKFGLAIEIIKQAIDDVNGVVLVST
jgi:predicted DNA-binding protein YlxM (UPF0122 family)